MALSSEMLQDLFDRFTRRQCSREELRELLGAVSDPQQRVLVESALDKYYGERIPVGEGVDNTGIDWETMFSEVIGNNGAIPGLNPASPRRVGIRWASTGIRWAGATTRWAAAAILILLVIGVYLWQRPDRSHPETAQAPASTPTNHNDIAPGGNKATLTLAGGQKIMLDSAHTGQLASQGNTLILKQDSGSLSYYSANDSSAVTSMVSYNMLSTPRGGQYKLVLPDGTKVWLDAASSIRYPTAFTGKNRQVSVTGEVYFEVVHDPQMPFMVRVGDQVVEDIGTAFNINAYPDEGPIRTTLLEGRVKLRSGNASVELIPGQQAEAGSASPRGASFSIHDNIDLEGVMAWKNGNFNFNNLSLEQVMRQLGRWYDLDIVYEGALPPMRFGGGISRSTSLSQVLKILQDSRIHYNLSGKKLIVKP